MVVTNADLIRQSRNYGLIESDESSGDDKKKKDKKERKKDKKRSRHEDKADKKKYRAKSDKGGGNDSSEDETKVVRKKKLIDDGQHVSHKEDVSEDEKHKGMDDDLAERDAFVQRLHEKEETKTKKAEGLTAEQIHELATKGSISAKNTDTIDQLREISRQHYLEKREEKELRLLEMSLRDEEDLFAGERLTKAERHRMDINKQILDMAKDKHRFTYKDDGYHIPDGYEDENGRIDRGKKDALLTARYEDEEVVKSEQEIWEEAKLKQYIGKDSKQKDDGYDFVFEDQIDFVSSEVLKISKDQSKKEKEKEKEKKKSKKSSSKKNKDNGDQDSDSNDEHDNQDDSKDNEEVEDNDRGPDLSRLTPHEQILLGRKKLPAYALREEFLQAVQDNKILVVEGQTGSGKTTQIPQFLHEAGWSKLGKIGCTQPRRVAAMSVAARVSQEMNCKLGQEVGYSIRFEDCTSENTIIKYMTDGMLLREFLTEPDLASYSCMIIDEAHERTLHTDVLFGLVKDISRWREDDFRLIISSATLDAEKFAHYFDDAKIFKIKGRMFDVEHLYTKAPEADYIDAVVVTILQIHITQSVPGDILVFLTGQEEIETCVEILAQRTKGLGSKIRELSICPIYANLPSDMQAKIFEPVQEGCRKVVLGTNIAETSLTIDGICYVIDTGFCKQKSYNPRTGMESLIVTPISRAASNQRAGRAGRTQPGKCFRLFTAWSYMNELEENTVPEIQRTNMGNVVLMLKSLGIDDLLNFDFMDKPPAESLIRALEQLYALGALNDRGELTKLGRRMAEFPLDPMMSKVLIASEKYGCSVEILTVVSMMSVGSSVFYRPKDKAIHADTAKMNFARGGGGDHMTLMRCYIEWEEAGYSTQWCYENFLQVRNLNKARDVREQLEGLCDRVEVEKNSNPADADAICKAIASGYFYNTAKFANSGEYKTTKNQHTVYIHPSSVLSKDEQPPPWLLYFELVFTTKEYMRTVCPIKGEWLIEIAPHYYKPADIEDPTTKKMPKQVKAVADADKTA